MENNVSGFVLFLILFQDSAVPQNDIKVTSGSILRAYYILHQVRHTMQHYLRQAVHIPSEVMHL